MSPIQRRTLLAATLSAAAGGARAQAVDKATLPLYTLIRPRPAKTAAPRWAAKFRDFNEVVGYSALGHLFMHSTKSDSYAVIYPYQANGKNYGPFKSIQAFEQQILRDDYFDKVILLRDHVAQIRLLKGALGPEQVYIARPYPFLGGSEAPETYDKGDVWVFLDIVAQAQGF